MNHPEVPIEIAPAGMSIQVSREYFKWNPIETADGSFQLTHFAGDAVPLGSPVRRIPKRKEQFLRKPFLANLLLMGYMSTVSESCARSCSEYSRYKSVFSFFVLEC